MPERVADVDGLENLSEFPKAIRWLVAHAHDDDRIRKLVGGNVLAALEHVWVST
jgi:membrane dipeptidase